MPDSNAPVRFEAGGTITIQDSAGTPVTLTLIAVDAGTMELEPGGYEPLPYLDRDVLKTPYEGAERAGRIKFNVKFSGGSNANDLYKHLTQRDTTAGKMHLYTVVVKWFDSKGAATFDTATFANCYIPSPPKIRTGVQFDTLEVELVHNAALPTFAAG